MTKPNTLKVSKSQNKFLKSLFLPKNERNIARISALTFRAESLAIFRLFFGRNDEFINVRFTDLYRPVKAMSCYVRLLQKFNYVCSHFS